MEILEHHLAIGAAIVRLRLVRNLKSRRYILRLKPDGTASVTIPRGGSIQAALDFTRRNVPWIERQLQKPRPVSRVPIPWGHGTEVMYRGNPTALVVEGNKVRLGDAHFSGAVGRSDLRTLTEANLRRLATAELKARTLELAVAHSLSIQRVTVRSQRSRWGSCSRRRTISLNWRLIQTPDFVRDYIILHELMHLHEMNHSSRYWRRVEQVCPDYLTAEKWLKQHAGLLR